MITAAQNVFLSVHWFTLSNFDPPLIRNIGIISELIPGGFDAVVSCEYALLKRTPSALMVERGKSLQINHQ